MKDGFGWRVVWGAIAVLVFIIVVIAVRSFD
jgi:hypothetical protein